MAEVETKIWLALRQRITSLPGGYAIAWPGAEFQKPEEGGKPLPFVDVTDFVNRPIRLTIANAPHDRRGVLQLMLNWPVASKDIYERMKEVAAAMAAHFPADLRLNFDDIEVRVYEAATIAAPERENAYWQWPISIRWQSYA